MVPSIANWPVCKTGSVQFAGIIGPDGVKPVVEKVDFDTAQAMPMLEATVRFAQNQLALAGRSLFCASWADNRLILCQETEPMVLLGGPDLNFDDVLGNLERCQPPEPSNILPVETPIEWESNLDRHFWNFLQIVERTTASRTLLLGFGQELYKLGITEGAIHEPGRLQTVSCIAKKFRTTARARRKITYFAGARRRKKTIRQPLLPLQLACAFGQSLDNGQSSIERGSAPWKLDQAGWPAEFPDTASFDDFREILPIRIESVNWLQNILKTDQASYFMLNTGDKIGTQVRLDDAGFTIENNVDLANQ